ncbi:MAG TPA: hypothetical protein PKL15_09445, partial [Saprospiraceae bacterium]|nr:hypothetical protein [Saprospiraceae bacterium]
MRWALVGLLVIGAAGAGYYFWKKPGKEADAGKPSFVNGAEPTLTASSPLLEALSPEQSGIDF